MPGLPLSAAVRRRQRPLGLDPYASPVRPEDLSGDEDAYTPTVAEAADSGGTLRQAVGRALRGFSAGFRATPSQSAHDPALGGLIGGLAGAGDISAQDEAHEFKVKSARELAAQKLSTSKREESDRQANRVSLEDRRQSGRLELERRRQAGARDRSTQAAATRAEGMGASVTDVAKLYDDAEEYLSYQGLFPGVPGYDAALETEVDRRAEGYRRLGATKLKAPPKPAVGGKQSLDDILFK